MLQVAPCQQMSGTGVAGWAAVRVMNLLFKSHFGHNTLEGLREATIQLQYNSSAI